MIQLLTAREAVITVIKRYEAVFRFALKFFVALFLFSFINDISGYDDRFAPLFTGSMATPFFLLTALLFAVFPPTLGNLLISVQLVMQLSSSPATAIIVGLILAMVLLFYSRMDPGKSYLIIAIILGFYFKIPYAVVIAAGLYFGITSIIPISVGTFLWNFVPLCKQLYETVKMPNELDLVTIPAAFFDLYDKLYTAITSDFLWIYFCFVFAMVVVSVHFVSRLSINYSREIAILLGGIVCVFGMITGSVVVDTSVSAGAAVFFTLVSVIIIGLISFFDIALEYNKAERVQFEDDDFYYYVKAVPKIKPLGATAANTVKEHEAVENPRERKTHMPNTAAPREPVMERGGGTMVFKKLADDNLFPDDKYTPDPPSKSLKVAPGNPRLDSPLMGVVKKRMTPEEYERYKARVEARGKNTVPPVYNGDIKHDAD